MFNIRAAEAAARLVWESWSFYNQAGNGLQISCEVWYTVFDKLQRSKSAADMEKCAIAVALTGCLKMLPDGLIFRNSFTAMALQIETTVLAGLVKVNGIALKQVMYKKREKEQTEHG